jgi:hypothetical protein
MGDVVPHAGSVWHQLPGARPLLHPDGMRKPGSRGMCARTLAAALVSLLLWKAPAARAQSSTGLEPRRDIANLAPLKPSATLPAGGSPRQDTANASASSTHGSEFGEQRILQRRAHVEPWSASLEGDFFYTDNAALAAHHRQADWYWRAGADISYTNRIHGPFFIDLSLQQNFFRYLSFDALDFDLTRFEGGFLMQAPWLDDSFFFARYRLERITEATFGSSLLTNHSLDLGLQKVWKISRGQQVFASVSTNLALQTDPGASERHEYSIALGYSLRLTQRVTAGLSYRGSRYEYTQIDRQDWNHIVAAGLTYEVTDWLRAGLNVSYTYNDSSLQAANYKNLLPGASLALHIAF